MISEDRTSIFNFVRSYRRRFIVGKILRLCVWAAFFLCLLLAVLQAVFAVFPWIALPFIFVLSCLVGAIFATGYAIVASTLKAPSLTLAARIIEQQSRLKNPLLAIAVELSQDSRTTNNQLTDLTCSRLAGELGDYPAAPRRGRLIVPLVLSTLVLGFWCFLNPLAPRLLDYWSLPFSGGMRSEIVVSPGSITVPMNAPVRLSLACGRTRFPSCRLAIAEIDGERTSGLFLRPDADGSFNFPIDSAKRTFSYRFELSGRGAIPAYTVTVAPPPQLKGLSVTITPPAYTHQQIRSLPEGQGDFEAYAGSTAQIAVKSNRLKAAGLIRDRDTVLLAIKGELALSNIAVRASGDYTFWLLDSLGQKSDSLPSFHIACIADQAPSVQILKPGRSRDLSPEQLETLIVEGVDDIGIRSMAVKWRLCGMQSGETGLRTLVTGNDAPIVRSSFVWRLAELSLYPGDTVYYWAEATDTRPGGGQTGRSDTFTFRIPTLDEMHKALAGQEDRAEKTLGDMRSKQRNLAEKMEEVLKATSGRKELSWEQRQILTDLKQEGTTQADSLRQTLASLKENVEKLKQEGTAGAELSRKVDQVRKAVDDLVKQFGDSLLFNMKDFDKPVSSQEMRAAIEKVQAALPKLGEQLETALKFLKMLKEDQKLAALAMRAEALAREQKTLSRSDTFGPSETAQQKDLLEKMRKLSEDASDQAREHADSAGGDSLPSSKNIDSLGKTMQQSVDMKQVPSRESMNRMSGSLMSLSDDLMRMMNFGTKKRLERERSRLLSLAQKALSMADWQQDLSQDPETLRNPASGALSQQAIQDALEKSKGAADSLSMTPPDQMGEIRKSFANAKMAMKEAMSTLDSRGGRFEATSGPITALRRLANTLMVALSKMDDGEPSPQGAGSGMMPGLRKLSGRQAAINSATSDLLRSMLNGSGTPQEGAGGRASEQARRAAQSAQQAIADDLKRLAEKYGDQSGRGMVGKAQDLQNEAQRLASMLEHPSAGGLVEHQDRFLARMLETTLSMHKEGEGHDEWKAQSAETPFLVGTNVGSVTVFREKDTFNRLRQRAFQGNYPEDYRDALQRYFESLSERYLK